MLKFLKKNKQIINSNHIKLNFDIKKDYFKFNCENKRNYSKFNIIKTYLKNFVVSKLNNINKWELLKTYLKEIDYSTSKLNDINKYGLLKTYLKNLVVNRFNILHRYRFLIMYLKGLAISTFLALVISFLTEIYIKIRNVREDSDHYFFCKGLVSIIFYTLVTFPITPLALYYYIKNNKHKLE